MKFTSQENLKYFWLKLKSKLSTVAFTGKYTDLANKPTSLPASDVYLWAKAKTKPSYTKSEVGLGNVDNTSDLNKPISTATKTELNTKTNVQVSRTQPTNQKSNDVWLHEL